MYGLCSNGNIQSSIGRVEGVPRIAKSTIAKGNENETNHTYGTMDIFHAAQLFDKPADQCSRRY